MSVSSLVYCFLLTLALGHAALAAVVTEDPTGIANRTFSFVIVGGGTAGLALANRLSEDGRMSVLVIEAGPNTQNNSMVNDPGMANNPGNLSWAYQSVTQLNGQQQVIAQGFGMGGSSSINGLQWGRGTEGQYNSIQALGNPGWDFASFVEYTKKAERFTIPTPQQVAKGVTFNQADHGFSGHVIAGFPNPYMNATTVDAIVTSAQQAIPGLVTTQDFTSGNPNGIGRWAFSLNPDNGAHPNLRSSSAVSYIFSLGSDERPNLTVLTGHRATRIIWADVTDHGEPVASGVQFVGSPSPTTSTGPFFTVQVSHEVIASAGAIGMLPRDLGGVVDPNLKVYGTNNVRVVDASIIPIQLSTHPSFTVYGVAEKAADIIKASL